MRWSQLLGVCLFLFSANVFAQDLSLQTGEIEFFWGIRTLSAQSFFDTDGTRKPIQEENGISNGQYREYFLDARVTYALHKRYWITLEAPAIRAASLAGEVFVGEASLGSRVESSIGFGDLLMKLTFPRGTVGNLHWAFGADVRFPVGNSGARLPRGTSLPGIGGSILGSYSGEKSFFHSSFRLGTGNGAHAEARTQIEAGILWKRWSVSGAIDARLAFPNSTNEVQLRDQLAGIASHRSDLRIGPLLSFDLRLLKVLVSLKAPVLGQNEAAGAEILLGFLLNPFPMR